MRWLSVGALEKGTESVTLPVNTSLYLPSSKRRAMPTLLQVYQQVCTQGLIPSTRQKDMLTSLRYLAASYDSTPDRLPVTEALETTYRPHLKAYLRTQGKKHATIRNSLQNLGQFL